MPSQADEGAPRAVILLSTYNGAAWLPAQLDSLAAQEAAQWRLLWRDDGSTDGSAAAIRAFAQGAGCGRCTELPEPAGNLGVLHSYMALLCAAVATLGENEALAFADQDDIWLPDKLARGLAALAGEPQDRPALHCTRLQLVDSAARPIGLTAAWQPPVGFPAALTQNIVTGCTLMLNRAAGRLLAGSAPPPGTLHDWWSYLVVSAAGGALLRDETPSVLYRQHGGNAVGVPASLPRRAVAALRRGQGVFMQLLCAHVAALLARPEALSEPARAHLERIDAALRGGWWARLSLLRDRHLRRQTALETAVFRAWLLAGGPAPAAE